jgi:hypothetical protein
LRLQLGKRAVGADLGLGYLVTVQIVRPPPALRHLHEPECIARNTVLAGIRSFAPARTQSSPRLPPIRAIRLEVDINDVR